MFCSTVLEMAPGTVPKPRRSYGTPAYRIINYASLSVIGMGILSGIALQFWDSSNGLAESFKKLYKFSDEDIDRRLLMRPAPPRRSEDMKKDIELRNKYEGLE